MNARIVLICSFFLLLGAGPTGAAVGDHLWSTGYGEWGRATVDGTGHVVTAAVPNSPVDFGGGLLSPATPGGTVVLVRHDPQGAHLWDRLFESTGYVGVDRVVADEAGRIFIVGSLFGSVFGTTASIDFGGGPISGDNEFFVAGFDAAGGHLFSRIIGVGHPQDIFARAGRVVVTGYTYGSLDFGGGPVGGAGGADVFLGSWTTSGAHVWSAAFGDASSQGGMAVALDAAGQVYLAATTDGAIDFGGGALTPSGPIGLCLVKFTAGGNHVSSQIIDGRFSSGVGILATLDLDVSDTGRVVLGGQMNESCDFGGGLLWSNGGGDAFVASFDASGVHQWSSNHGGSITDFVSSVAFDSEENVVLVGTFRSSSIDFGNGPIAVGPAPADPFLVVMDPNGAPLLSTSFTTGGSIYSVDVGTAPGRIFFSGRAQSGLDLGGGPLDTPTMFHGMFEGTPGTSTAAPALRSVQLEQNHPNPFNPSTTIRYHVGQAGPVEITVTDLAGRSVATLWRGSVQAGTHSVQWNGRDDDGVTVAGGVYVYRLHTTEGTSAGRMTLVK